MTTYEKIRPPAGGERAIEAGTVPYDLSRLMRKEGRADVREMRCSEFASEIIDNFGPARA